MKGAVCCRPAEPGQNDLFFHFAFLLAQYSPVGRVGPICDVLAKSVMNGVIVNIVDQLNEVSLVLYSLTSKIINEQGSPALIHLIVSFGITVEKVAELLHDKFRVGKITFNQRFIRIQCLGVVKKGCFISHSHQKMEMVAHEAVGVSLADGVNVLGILFQKVAVVVIVIKEIIPANGVIIEVIVLIRVEWIGVFHTFNIQDLIGF